MYFFISLLASTFGAIAGLGGGVIIKPVLDFFGHYDVGTIGILSAATVFSMACVSLVKSVTSGIRIKGEISLVIAFGSIVGGIFGKLLFNYIVETIGNSDKITAIQASFLAFLMIVIFILINNKKKIKTYELQNYFFIFIVGLVLGVIAAFLGIGGGPLNVAILALVFSMSAKDSAINSIFIIFFSQISSLILSASTTGFYNFELSMLPFMISGGVVGGFLGSVISNKFGNKEIEKMFNLSLMTIFLLNIYNMFTYFL